MSKCTKQKAEVVLTALQSSELRVVAGRESQALPPRLWSTLQGAFSAPVSLQELAL